MKEAPEGMIDAAVRALGIKVGFESYAGAHRKLAGTALEAGLKWLEENPTTPDPQLASLLEDMFRYSLRESYKMMDTIERAGDHYTYRDALRGYRLMHEFCRNMMVGILGYSEAETRLNRIENKCFEESRLERATLL